MQRFASVVLVDRRGHLLLQERDERPVISPNQWSFCGGHVEDGESVEAAAYRELTEETGIELPPGTLELFTEVQVQHETLDLPGLIQVFVAEVDLTDADVECHEGRQIVFVDPATVFGLDLSTAAQQVLPALLASETYARLSSSGPQA